MGRFITRAAPPAIIIKDKIGSTNMKIKFFYSSVILLAAVSIAAAPLPVEKGKLPTLEKLPGLPQKN